MSPYDYRYVAFIDEVGDYGMDRIDPKFPVFGACAYTAPMTRYIEADAPRFVRLKYDFFGNECVVIHGHKIRQKSGDFSALRDKAIFELFMDGIVDAFANLEGRLICAAVHKERLRGQYIDPINPFFLSIQFLLERLHLHWSGHLRSDRRLLCVFEMRGSKEDARTLGWFNRICAGENFRGNLFHFDADFRPKDHNVVGHQYADLAAYSLARYVERGDEKRKDWQAIKPKLARSWNGKIDGVELKIFP